MTLNELLRVHSFTAGLSDSQIARLASLAFEVRFAEDERILVAGERSKNLYLLLHGSVCVEVSAPNYTVCIQVLGPAETFGWSALLDDHDTLFQVRARESSTALCLSGAALNQTFQEDPQLAILLLRRALKIVAGRLKATEVRLGELCGVRMPKDELSPSAGESPY